MSSFLEILDFSKLRIHQNCHLLEIVYSAKLTLSRNFRFIKMIVFSKSLVHRNCDFLEIVDSPKVSFSRTSI